MHLPLDKAGLKFYSFVFLVLAYILALILLNEAGYFRKPLPCVDAPLHREIQIAATVTDVITGTGNTKRFSMRTCSLDNKKIVIKLFSRPRSIPDDIRAYDRVVFTGKIMKPEPPRNPGEFDYRKYLSVNGYYGLVNIKSITSVVHTHPGMFYRVISTLRNRMAGTIQTNISGEEAAVLLKLFTGAQNALPEDIKNTFIDAGVMHVLVVSGLHVVYVAGMFLFIFRFIPISNRLRSALLIVPIIIYCFVTGANPPIVRATIMSVSLIISYLLKRDNAAYHSFALSALIILLLNPRTLFNPSMQLSYAACLGIVYIYPKIKIDRVNFLKNSNIKNKYLLFVFSFFFYIASLFLVSLSAQLAVTPIIANYFFKISLVALVSNIIIVPLSGIIIILCFGLFFATLILPFSVPAIGYLCYISTNIFVKITAFFASMPHAIIYTGQPSTLFFVLYYVALIGVFKIRNLKYRLISAVSCIVLFIFMAWAKHNLIQPLKLTFLDLEMGNCILISTPDNKNILVDCGGKNNNTGEYSIKPFLMAEGITYLDNIIITTPMWTHYSGLKTLIDNFKIREIIIPGGNYENIELESLLKLAKQNNIVITVPPGQEKQSQTKTSLRGVPKGRRINLNIELFQDNSDNEFPCFIIKLTYGNNILLLARDSDWKTAYSTLGILKNQKLVLLEINTLNGSRPAIVQKKALPACLISNNPFNWKKTGYFRLDKTGAICVKMTKEKTSIRTFLKQL